jgi:hypothetical protein
MSGKRLLMSFSSVAALAAFSITPAAAQATPQFHINGMLAGATPQNVVQFGTITMKSPFWGEIKCNVLVGAPVSNESEKGVAPVQGWETSDCRMPECLRGSASFVMAEGAVKLVEPLPGHPPEAVRGEKTLPWPAELVTSEKGTKLKIRGPEGVIQGLKVLVNCPGEGFEVPYEGTLEPNMINGSTNGLHPSHLEFEGSGGKTGHLVTPDICGGECTQAELSVSGSLTILGTMQQLITAE